MHFSSVYKSKKIALKLETTIPVTRYKCLIFWHFSCVGWENFLNITQLGDQDHISFAVRINEDPLHAATMHFMASQFQAIYERELKYDPDWDQKVKYRSFKVNKETDDYERRYFKDDYYRQERRKFDYDQHSQHKRYWSPPSEVKHKIFNEHGKEGMTFKWPNFV